MNKAENPTGPQWPTIEGMDTGAAESSACAEPAQPVRTAPDPHAMADAMAAQDANRAARHEAQARGAGVATVAAVMNGTAAEPPEIPDWGRPCRMTAALRQIMLKWAKLPPEDRLPDNVCLMFCFLKPRLAWTYLEAFNESTLTWQHVSDQRDWRSKVMTLALDLTDAAPEVTEDLARWVTERITDFFGRPGETPAMTTPPPSETPAAELREAGPAGGSAPSTASPPLTPVATSLAPCGTLT